MTDLELNKLRNMLTSYQLVKSDIKLMKGRWYKLYNKVFTDTFGIEIEIPNDSFKISDTDLNVLNSNIYNQISDKYYFKFLESKFPEAVKRVDSTKCCDLGIDCGDREFRMFVSKNSLGLLNKVIGIIKHNMKETTDIIYTLHIHIPINKHTDKCGEFLKKIRHIEALHSRYYREVEIILKYLMQEWRPDWLMEDFIYRFNIEEFTMKFKRYLKNVDKSGTNYCISKLVHCCGNTLCIKENSEFNTIEFRGMHTEVSYENIMKKVFLVSVLNNLLFYGKTDHRLIQEALLIIENE